MVSDYRCSSRASFGRLFCSKFLCFVPFRAIASLSSVTDRRHPPSRDYGGIVGRYQGRELTKGVEDDDTVGYPLEMERFFNWISAYATHFLFLCLLTVYPTRDEALAPHGLCRRLWSTELKPQGWTDSARIDEVMRPPMTELRADTDAKDNDGRTLQHLAAISRS